MENQAPNNEQGYTSVTRAKRLNCRQRRARQKQCDQSRVQARVQQKVINPQPRRILEPVKNLPVRDNYQDRALPLIIGNKIIKQKIKIIYFKEGRRIPPPVDGDYRDKLLCRTCRKKYKNEFCQICVNIKLKVVPDPTKVRPNEELSYLPLTNTY